MKTTLRQKAEQILTSWEINDQSVIDPGILAIGFKYIDEAAFVTLLERSIAGASKNLPIQGILLWNYFCNTSSKELSPKWTQEHYQIIKSWHQTLYNQYDLSEEGLPIHPAKTAQLQDPLFLSLLVWSNECLIQVGHSIQEDVLDIIQWNELTIYSMNEKLWDNKSGYYQSFDLQTNKYVPPTNLNGFAPMCGEVPTQEQAEKMLKKLTLIYQKAALIDPFQHWWLINGLIRYDFTSYAKKIRIELKQIMEKFGFHNIYYNNLEMLDDAASSDPPILAAAIALDLFNKS